MPTFSFTLNGEATSVTAAPDEPMLWVLRDMLGVTGPKYGCGVGVCKACTSHLDGKAFNPCVTNLRDVAGKKVTTIEGLADGDQLHPVQEAWLEQDVAQCGYCQPGQIMAAVALLKRTSNPTDEDIDAIENVCRCGSYFRIREAIKAAAAKMSAQAAGPVTEPAAVPDGQLPATGLDAKTVAVGAAALAAAAAARLVSDDGAGAADPA